METSFKDKYSLDKTFKEKWIKALKSGNYKQGSGSLKRYYENIEPRYCCLGVACSVAGVPEEYISGEWIDENNFDLDGFSKIPKVLQGCGAENELVGKLSGMNDDTIINSDTDEEEHKSDFEKIADWINKNIKGVDNEKS